MGESGPELGTGFVAGGEALKAGLSAQGSGEVTLAGSGRATEEETATLADPQAVTESVDGGRIEVAGSTGDDGAETGLIAEAGTGREPVSLGQAAVLGFGFEEAQEKGHEGLEGVIAHTGHAQEAFMHTVEAEVAEQGEQSGHDTASFGGA